jgi:hypothetical protein
MATLAHIGEAACHDICTINPYKLAICYTKLTSKAPWVSFQQPEKVVSRERNPQRTCERRRRQIVQIVRLFRCQRDKSNILQSFRHGRRSCARANALQWRVARLVGEVDPSDEQLLLAFACNPRLRGVPCEAQGCGVGGTCETGAEVGAEIDWRIGL